jgi:hypothetical protein
VLLFEKTVDRPQIMPLLKEFVMHIGNVFFLHDSISFIKYTYKQNTNLTCVGLEHFSRAGIFVFTLRIRFMSLPSSLKGEICVFLRVTELDAGSFQDRNRGFVSHTQYPERLWSHRASCLFSTGDPSQGMGA